MPLYEYECTACHKRTEKIQKFSDPEITACPRCGGVLERVISAPAISFKGGGWFADGYGSAKPSGAASSDAAGGTEGASSGASESKASSETSGASSPPAAAPSAAPASAASSSAAPPSAAPSQK